MWIKQVESMDAADLRDAKERVQARLIEPLERDGMRRTEKGVEDHEAFLERVRRAVCYMSDDQLDMLAAALPRRAITCSKCGRREGWPSLIEIRDQAHAIAPAPIDFSPMVTSYMASGAGEWAWSEGANMALALLRYLVKKGHPPTEQNGGWRVIREDAEALGKRQIKRAELIHAGVATDEDKRVEASYWRRLDTVRELVDAGERAA